MKRGRPGPDTVWMKLSSYQAFLYAQQGLLASTKKNHGRYLVLKPFRPKFAARPNGKTSDASWTRIPKR